MCCYDNKALQIWLLSFNNSVKFCGERRGKRMWWNCFGLFAVNSYHTAHIIEIAYANAFNRLSGLKGQMCAHMNANAMYVREWGGSPVLYTFSARQPPSRHNTWPLTETTNQKNIIIPGNLNDNPPIKGSGVNRCGPKANGWKPWCRIFERGSRGPSTVTLIALL